MRIVNNNYINLMHKQIARNISHIVRNDPEICVNAIKEEIGKLFQAGCSYKKGWYAWKTTIELLFGSWSETFTLLPKHMHALEDSNSGMIIRWNQHQSSTEIDKVFLFMF